MADDDDDQAGQQEHARIIKEIIEKRLESESFSDWARHVLTYERGRAAGFEARLKTQWQEALELFELIYYDAAMLGDALNQQYRPQAAADNDIVFEAIVRLHARACGITSEVYALLKAGHAGGAFARWRSLHEVLIVVQLIRANGSELAERFLLHDVVQRYLAACKYQIHAATLGEEPFDQSEIDEMEHSVKMLCDKFQDPSFAKQLGWASKLLGGKNLTWNRLEQEAKLSHLRPYYSLASDSVHAGIKGMKRTVFTMGEDIMLAGPANSGLVDPANFTMWALYHCTVALLTLRLTDEGEAELAILAQLVSQAQEAFARIQAKIEQDEAKLRAEQSKAQTE